MIGEHIRQAVKVNSNENLNQKLYKKSKSSQSHNLSNEEDQVFNLIKRRLVKNIVSL